jgi:UTP--glucose-1-phosphate uridylyltransferase
MPVSITQAILPVAGLGTRFLPWTKAVPKELLPLGNQLIIALLVDECLSVGIRDICFVISRGKESIPRFFQPDQVLEEELKRRGKLDLLKGMDKYRDVTFTVMEQTEMLGDGHAILQAANWVTSDAVAILFGDDLIGGPKNGLQQLMAAYATLPEAQEPSTAPAMLCLENVPREMTSRYGIADTDESKSNGRLKRVKGLVEKPKPEDAPSTLGVVGKYIIPRSTFGVLPTVKGSVGGEIRLIDALIAQLGSMAVYGYEVEGKRYDTGTPEGYREAVKDLA